MSRKRTPAAERVLMVVLQVLIVAVPLLSSGRFTRFLELKWEVLTIGCIVALCMSAAVCRLPVRLPSFERLRPFLLLWLCVIVSVFCAHNRHDAVRYALRLCVLTGLYGVIRRSAMSTGNIWHLLRFSVLTALAVLLTGLAAGFLAPGSGWSLDAIYPTFGNSNIAAQYLVTVAPAALAMAGAASKPGRRVFWILAAMCVVVFLAVTGARGAYLGVLAGAGVFLYIIAHSKGWFERIGVKKMVAAGALLVVLAGGIVAASVVPQMLKNERQEMIRPHLWACAVRMVTSRPVFGVGPGNFPVRFGFFDGYRGRWAPGSQYKVQYAHGDYFQTAAEYGLLGLVAVGWIVLGPVAAMWRAGWRSFRDRPLWAAGASLASVVGVLVHALVSFPLLMPASAFGFWLNLGFVAVLADRASPAAPAPPEDAARGRSFSCPRLVWVAICVGGMLAASAMPFRFLMSDFYLARAKAAIKAGKAASAARNGRTAWYYARSAERDVDEAFRYDINNRAAWFQKGVACTAQKKYRGAAAAYKQAISLLPDYHVQHYNLGNVYLKMGNDADAEREFLKASAIHPRYEMSRNALERFYARRGRRKGYFSP